MSDIHAIGVRLFAIVFLVFVALVVATARADTSAASPGTHVGERSSELAASACRGLSPEQAREIAEAAQREHAHRKAAECFRVAGDPVRADYALVRASADSSAAASRKVTETVQSAKAQMRELRNAFR
jgi:hypothetical protein